MPRAAKLATLRTTIAAAHAQDSATLQKQLANPVADLAPAPGIGTNRLDGGAETLDLTRSGPDTIRSG